MVHARNFPWYQPKSEFSGIFPNVFMFKCAGATSSGLDNFSFAKDLHVSSHSHFSHSPHIVLCPFPPPDHRQRFARLPHHHSNITAASQQQHNSITGLKAACLGSKATAAAAAAAAPADPLDFLLAELEAWAARQEGYVVTSATGITQPCHGTQQAVF